MQHILITGKYGAAESFTAASIPFSEQELEYILNLYYRGKNCDRCRRAIIESGFARLLMELEEDGALSEGTLALFPVLKDCADISIIQK